MTHGSLELRHRDPVPFHNMASALLCGLTSHLPWSRLESVTLTNTELGVKSQGNPFQADQLGRRAEGALSPQVCQGEPWKG